MFSAASQHFLVVHNKMRPIALHSFQLSLSKLGTGHFFRVLASQVSEHAMLPEYRQESASCERGVKGCVCEDSERGVRGCMEIVRGVFEVVWRL